MLIPLIRPLMPNVSLLTEYLEAPYASGVWSNFGPLHNRACDIIREMTGRFPVLTSSATSALNLILSEFDENYIAIPDFTHSGTFFGSSLHLPDWKSAEKVYLMSCDPKTKTPSTKALDDYERCHDFWGNENIMVIVNPFGYGVNRKRYLDFLSNANLSRAIVFDYAGAWGDFDIDDKDDCPTVFSFHATKSLPIGEGGMALFSTIEEAENFRAKTNFNTYKDRRIYTANTGTGNMKLSELSCAMLCAQLDPRQYPRILSRIENRRELLRYYQAELKVEVNPEKPAYPSLCVVDWPLENAIGIETYASSQGFIAKQYYMPLHKMPAFSCQPTLGDVDTPSALDHCLALPSDVTMEEARHVVDRLKAF